MLLVPKQKYNMLVEEKGKTLEKLESQDVSTQTSVESLSVNEPEEIHSEQTKSPRIYVHGPTPFQDRISKVKKRPVSIHHKPFVKQTIDQSSRIVGRSSRTLQKREGKAMAKMTPDTGGHSSSTPQRKAGKTEAGKKQQWINYLI